MFPLSEETITSADKTFFQLRSDIVEGKIPHGSKLSEAELGAKYRVSRAVIREAINRLTASNLVERKSNVGAKVISLSSEGLVQLYQVREALEGMAARLAATNMSEAQIAELKRLLSDQFQEVQKGHSYYQEAGDLDFHYRIIVGSHNSHLISMLLNGIYHLIRMYRVQFGMAGPRVTTAFEEHKNIAQAIYNRDGELAEMLMRRHILYSMKNIQQKFSSTGKERKA